MILVRLSFRNKPYVFYFDLVDCGRIGPGVFVAGCPTPQVRFNTRGSNSDMGGNSKVTTSNPNIQLPLKQFPVELDNLKHTAVIWTARSLSRQFFVHIYWASLWWPVRCKIWQVCHVICCIAFWCNSSLTPQCHKHTTPCHKRTTPTHMHKYSIIILYHLKQLQWFHCIHDLLFQICVEKCPDRDFRFSLKTKVDELDFCKPDVDKSNKVWN